MKKPDFRRDYISYVCITNQSGAVSARKSTESAPARAPRATQGAVAPGFNNAVASSSKVLLDRPRTMPCYPTAPKALSTINGSSRSREKSPVLSGPPAGSLNAQSFGKHSRLSP